MAKNTEQFIQQSIQVHGDKFDYSLVLYKNTHTKVKIICPIHGEFEQIPNDHIRGNGCYQCSGRSNHKSDIILNKIKQIHIEKGTPNYDYSRFVYKNLDTKVKIICPIHGEFEITPRSITLQKAGCKHCGNKLASDKRRSSNDAFITAARKVHDDTYNYSNVQYVRNNTKVVIGCLIHGDFNQTPTNHLQNEGCPRCARESSKGKGGYTYGYFANHPEQQDIPAVLYTALITNGNERFIKIGITAKTTQHRFNRGEYKNMNIEMLYEKNLPLFEAFQMEQRFIEDMKPYKFFSNTKFSGYTECFRIDHNVLTRVNEIFQIAVVD